MTMLLKPEAELKLFGLLFLLAALALLALYAFTAPGGDDAFGEMTSAFASLTALHRSF